ncbi:Cro/CI family transcriptional regulator [Massilia sp.]|uniref:Cro/CI family transcriptional regulator n=1 Tax=Massilia sp. TaxID=1882437 RepID=UPI0028993D8C|nr:Cro/CI family transcriptional regulator [Massilia sp.]
MDNEASKIIDDLGGTAKVAALCEVTMAAVSQWRESGIPKPRLMFLKLARPDVFGPTPSMKRRKEDLSEAESVAAEARQS